MSKKTRSHIPSDPVEVRIKLKETMENCRVWHALAEALLARDEAKAAVSAIQRHFTSLQATIKHLTSRVIPLSGQVERQQLRLQNAGRHIRSLRPHRDKLIAILVEHGFADLLPPAPALDGVRDVMNRKTNERAPSQKAPLPSSARRPGARSFYFPTRRGSGEAAGHRGQERGGRKQPLAL